MRQRFQTGKGGRLVFYPPESRQFGPASSSTVTLKRAIGDDVPDPVNGLAATVDAFSSTLAAAADAESRKLTLASVTGLVVGRRYLIQSIADGEILEAKVDGINLSTNDVLLRDPLGRALEPADTFKGEEVSFLLSAANTPNTAIEATAAGGGQPIYPYRTKPWLFRAEWSYAIGATSYTADQTYEVWRRLLKPPISPLDLMVLLPGTLQDAVGGVGHTQAADVIETAWSDLLDDITGAGLNPDRIMNPDRLTKPHRSRALAVLSTGWLSDAGRQYHDAREQDYRDDLGQLLSSQDWYDHTADAQEQPGEVLLHTTVIRR